MTKVGSWRDRAACRDIVAAEYDPFFADTAQRFVFDITDAVDDLEAAGAWDDRAVAVCFQPALPEGFEPQPPPAARVGRLFVTHG